MSIYDIVFYSMNTFVFIIMVYLIFMVAKHENYSKGYRDGYLDSPNKYDKRSK